MLFISEHFLFMFHMGVKLSVSPCGNNTDCRVLEQDAKGGSKRRVEKTA